METGHPQIGLERDKSVRGIQTSGIKSCLPLGRGLTFGAKGLGALLLFGGSDRRAPVQRPHPESFLRSTQRLQTSIPAQAYAANVFW